MMKHGKELPPLTLSKTSIANLVSLIPVLVSMTSRGQVPSYEDDTDKPAWWPDDVQWKNPKTYAQESQQKGEVLKVLRKLVHSCYSYHGLEELLCRLDEASTFDHTEFEPMDAIEVIPMTDDNPGTPGESSAESEGPVFVCCFCLDQFSSHQEVSSHQQACPKRFQESSQATELPAGQVSQQENQSATVSPSSGSRPQPDSFLHLEPDADLSRSHVHHVFSDVAYSDIRSPVSSSSSSFISSSSSSSLLSSASTQDKQALIQYSQASSWPAPPVAASKRPSQTSSSNFVPILKTRSQKKLDQIMEKHTLRRLMKEECEKMTDVPASGAWWIRKRRRKQDRSVVHPDTYINQDTFSSSLGLTKTSELVVKTEPSKEVKKEPEVDLDCQIISVEGPLSSMTSLTSSLSSTSPRSARSLMSQLSRDTEASGSRRRLSFCFVEDEWADKEALEEGRNPLQMSLLTLDVTSPLGQRVRKYVKGEAYLNVIKDPENYCKTEDIDDSYSKLRFRASDFRVTFRRKKRASNFVHKYKFNRRDRKEFEIQLKTGLNSRSRRLKRSLPSCKMVLHKLTDQEIKYWQEEKKITIAEKIVYDDDICITQIDIPESKLSQGFLSDKSKLGAVSKVHQMYTPSHPHIGHHSTGPQASPASCVKQSLMSRQVPSPPHVPNIFRNRTSHLPSPPRPASSHHAKPWKPGCPSLLEKRLTSGGHGPSSQVARDLFGRNASQLSGTEKARAGMGHLSGHQCLSPSAYRPASALSGHAHSSKSGYRQDDQNSALHGSNNSNRRKQQLTSVRRDDGEASVSHKHHSHMHSAGFLPLGKPNTNPYSRSFATGQKSVTGKTNNVNSSTSHNSNLTSSGGKLANFDYFSIRAGKIHPSTQPQHQHTSVLPYKPAASGNSHPAHGNYQAHRHNHCHPVTKPSPNQQPNPRHMSNSASGQPRPSHHPANHTHSSNWSGHPPGMKEMKAKHLTHMKHSHNNAVANHSSGVTNSVPTREPGDDDVLEVICIDDD